MLNSKLRQHMSGIVNAIKNHSTQDKYISYIYIHICIFCSSFVLHSSRMQCNALPNTAPKEFSNTFWAKLLMPLLLLIFNCFFCVIFSPFFLTFDPAELPVLTLFHYSFDWLVNFFCSNLREYAPEGCDFGAFCYS